MAGIHLLSFIDKIPAAIIIRLVKESAKYILFLLSTPYILKQPSGNKKRFR